MANETETERVAFERLDTALEQIPPTGETGAAALAVVDQIMETADRAIHDAQRVFVSDTTRTRLAALRAELYGRPVPVESADERTRLPDAGGQLDATAANLLVGLVERALRDLGEVPGEWDALDLVRSWLERGQRGEDNTDGALSALHLIAAERASPVGRAPETVIDDALARLPREHWQRLLALFSSALADRRPVASAPPR
ncbi:MAG: hypothetical protein HS111_06895 [Kofleriaceae bacterium]|nr:hypothetical protein [Kofleriaceae bacterium]MCL4225590.1 hypothetical protein [Myxococcales bacterium]